MNLAITITIPKTMKIKNTITITMAITITIRMTNVGNLRPGDNGVSPAAAAAAPRGAA